MTIRPSEILSVLKHEIDNISVNTKSIEAGSVIQVGDGVARIQGLPKAMAGDLVEFQNGTKGYILNLEEDNIGCLLLGSDEDIHEGDIVTDTGKILSVPVGPELLGRVVDALGTPIDGKGDIVTKETRNVESPSPGIIYRQPVTVPLQTGIQAIDALIPIGRGQRELIIGDRQTGKTSIAIDTIINQKDKNCFCVYVAIGQKMSTISQIIDVLKKYDALKNTIVVVASASDTAAMQYIAPFAGCAMGEYFRDKGQDVLCVYDDLSKHAVAYRQVSLLLRRPPGREAFPADIFYLHSRLLERAARLSPELGGGSLTALPIIETQAGDASAYIPTNVISITDGQIILEATLFNSGVRPAINAGLSVSRVGGSAQVSAMKKIAGPLRLELAQYRELAAFSQFSKDLDKATQNQLSRGEHLVELLKQPVHDCMSVSDQIIAIFASTKGYTDKLGVKEISGFISLLQKYVRKKHPEFIKNFEKDLKFTDEVSKDLCSIIEEFLAKLYMPRYHSAELKAQKALEELKEKQSFVTLEIEEEN
jgi:F-type H+-transporting ATPase subunit alpha